MLRRATALKRICDRQRVQNAFYDSVDDSLLKWAAVKEILQYQWGVI